jgi:hypothetical protein
MKRRTTRANNSFLLGSLVLIVLVLVVVVLFLFLSLRLFDNKNVQYTERYEIVLDQSALDTPLSIYLNDSLLYSGTPRPDLKLSVGRFAQESSLLIVDNNTDIVSTIALSNHSETVTVIKDKNGSYRKKLE